MARGVYLLCYPVRNSRSHFAIWVPSTANDRIGRLINVVGNPFQGFELEVKRGYDLDDERASIRGPFLLGHVDDGLVVDDAAGGNDMDALERAARETPPPPKADPTLLPTLPSKWAQPIPGVERCQEWTRKLVEALIAQEILPASALDAFDAAPKT